MRGDVSVEVMRADQLGRAEQAVWQAFRAARPELDSPYFDVRYALAAGAVAPGAHVAVLHRQGAPIGFFPFQRRLGAIQPLGAPMTDFHGVIAAPGEEVDLRELLAALGARAYRFAGLTGAGASAGEDVAWRPAMAADLSGGFDAWLASRQAEHPRFFKGKRRAARAIERDLGPLRLEWSRRSEGVLDYVVGLKRAQYRRTRRHDVFACGWTQRLLRRLDEAREDDFGLTYASLYAGDTLVGAEVALMSGGVLHLWLPVYELRHARYGPGMLMTLESLRAAAGAGIVRADFGCADADYKTYFASVSGHVAEGCVHLPGGLTAMRTQLSRAAPPLASFASRVGRRVDVIAACETTTWGWCAAAALAAGVFLGSATTTSAPAQLRRPYEQRTGSTLVARTEGQLRQEAGYVPPQPG
jgi:CelD/BcsL family acetyltransferase involved in cellulose biosynthesis